MGNLIQSKLSARVHGVMRVEVFFDRPQDRHLLLAQVIFHPWSNHAAYTMVVA
jgi:hypothetical protein